VLHHLADPLAGLAALRGVLRPGGAMNIMLYGRYGRLGIDMLQEILRRTGAACDTAGIADARRWFWNLPRQNPFRDSLLRLNDINYDAGVADLLLHPRERNYTVPEIYEFLSRAGLVLQRFLCQAHYKPRCSAIATEPALLERTQSLPPSGQHAITELFRGDMKKHVFIACRDDRPVSEYGIDFAGDGWQQLVPIRNPGIEASRDNLPPGGIARLRWGVHEYPEIAAVVDDSQARLFDLVNGERTIAEIIAASGVPGDPGALDGYARNFFESMWDFDYFWFRKPPDAPGPVLVSEPLD
jgi:SAM-dependent methyltransferase